MLRCQNSLQHDSLCCRVNKASAELRPNRGHGYELTHEYITQIIARCQGTRRGRQELEGEILDAPEGAWFGNFSESRHVMKVAFRSDLPLQIGLDIGVGRFAAAVVFQAEKPSEDQTRFLVIGDYLAEGLYTEQDAPATKEIADQFAGGQVLSVWCDPAASARTGIGPSAMSEIVRIFGDRPVARSPQAPILDSLDMIEFILDHEDLLIHP